jgi:hypothetical protein
MKGLIAKVDASAYRRQLAGEVPTGGIGSPA